MPSPVGHALGGIAAGWLMQPGSPGVWSRETRARTLGFAALGMAADLDLLLGTHRGPTHSLTAALIVGVTAWAILGRDRRSRWLALAAAAAYASHPLLDWLGEDSSPPLGLQVLWPWSAAYLHAPWPIFLAVSRRLRHPELFWVPNVLALARELVILVPVVALVGWWRSRSSSGRRAGRI
ncbi:MAG: metal-dependent hydrolase [Vicinamibacterales bacterium]